MLGTLSTVAEKATTHERGVFVTLIVIGMVAVIVAYMSGGKGGHG